MRLEVSQITLSRHHGMAAAAASATLVSMSATPAYGVTLTEVVDRVGASPIAMFCMGCAAGAILGGLVAGLAARSSRKRLYESIEELSADAQRAEAAAQRANRELEEYRARHMAGQTPNALEQDPLAPYAVSAMSAAAAPATPEPSTATPEPATPAAPAASAAPAPPVPTVAEQTTGNLAAKANTSRIMRRSVRETLGSRLSSNALDEMPTIGRGQVVTAPPTLAEQFPGLSQAQANIAMRAGMTHGGQAQAPAVPQADPLAATGKIDRFSRSSIIDRRIPKIGDLFPEVHADEQAGADQFEQAMQAIDDMTRELVQEQQRDEETARHVENLIQEEMEINKSQSARRYSRSQLTVYDGGDAGDPGQTGRYRARHLPPVTKEA